MDKETNKIECGIVRVLLNFRSRPDLEGDVKFHLRPGQEISILEDQGEWLKIEVHKEIGYVNSHFIRRRANEIEDHDQDDKNKNDVKSSEPITPELSISLLEDTGDKTKTDAKTLQTTDIKPDLSGSLLEGIVQVPEGLSLNMYEEPGHNILKTLSNDTIIKVMEKQANHLKVQVDGEDGFVSINYVKLIDSVHERRTTKKKVTKKVTKKRPPSDRCQIIGDYAITPDGEKFGKKFQEGIINSGETSIMAYIKQNAEKHFFNTSPSVINVLKAVSPNQSNFEAINTSNDTFISFGIFQWSAGTSNNPGELPALLAHLKREKQKVFDKYFKSVGLDICDLKYPVNWPPVGYFLLNNKRLNTEDQKEKLRDLNIIYRFWLAAHDDDMRHVQIKHAIARIKTFYQNEKLMIGRNIIEEIISSEYGVALLLDQFVYGPGQLLSCLESAVKILKKKGISKKPERWTSEDERELIKNYLKSRETVMTDSNNRAGKIYVKVQSGELSNERHSFKMEA
ncbi:MAG: SH3 domain-containing protein [Candidatus Magnetomorum sp.]|nr:SH3 domain-containing protein [Candidatus Magnetomorum sp.]